MLPLGAASILGRWTSTGDVGVDRVNGIVKPAGKQATGDNAPRPAANENYLLISAFAAASHSPLVAISKRISDCGCNLAEARVAALGSDLSVLALAQGSWDAIAKLETALARLERDGGFRLTHFRTGAKEQQSNLLPYVVEVVAADKTGVLFQLAEFFARQGITIEQLHSTRRGLRELGRAEVCGHSYTGLLAGDRDHPRGDPRPEQGLCAREVVGMRG